jgi:hypothetical protein
MAAERHGRSMLCVNPPLKRRHYTEALGEATVSISNDESDCLKNRVTKLLLNRLLSTTACNLLIPGNLMRAAGTAQSV